MIKNFFLFGIFALILTSTRLFGVPVGLMMSFLSGALLLLVTWKTPALRVPWHPWVFPAFLLILGGLMATPRAINLPAHLIEVVQMLWFLIFFLSGVIIASRLWFNALFWSLLLAVALVSGVAIFDSRTLMGLGPMIASISFNADGLHIGFPLNSNKILLGWSFYRFAGTFHHPNALGGFTIVGFPLALGVFFSATSTRKFSLALLAALLAGLIAWANALSGSVSSFLGLVLSAGVIVLALYVRRLTIFKISILILIVFGLLTAGFFAYQNGLVALGPAGVWLERNFGRALDITGPIRNDLLDLAFYYIRQSPLIGYGLDYDSLRATTNAENDYLWVHNGIILQWLSGGLLALIGALIAYFLAFKLAFVRALAFVRGQATWVELSLAASIFGWIFFDMFQPASFFPYTWITVAMLYAISSHPRASVSATPSAATPIHV